MRKDVVNRSQNWRGLTPGAKLLISLVVAAGTGVLLYGAIHPTSKNIAQFICYLLIAILASRLKVNLPGITGTMSVNFLFILLGILELSFTETLVLGTASIMANSKTRSGTSRKWQTSTCEPLKLWLWPSKPRITLRTITYSACECMPSKWQKSWP